MTQLRVLYLHMTGAFGGASRSLFEAIRAFPAGAVEAKFVTQRGTAAAVFSEVGEVEPSRGMAQVDHTRYSHYRGVRWLVLLREVAFLPFTTAALWRAKRRWGRVDLIHLNEFTGLVPLWIARRMFGAPAIVHVRSIAHDDVRCRRTLWLHRCLRREAAAIIAIDENVRSSLPGDLNVEVIHNGFAPNQSDGPDEAFERRLPVLRADSFKVGFVGNLLRVKGIEELIEAARLTRDRGLDVEFIVVGDDARPGRGFSERILNALGLKQDLRADIEAALDRYRLRDRVHLVGFTTQIARAYRLMDVLCFPSHYDAPGRPIFEAGFFGVPSIVAVQQPRSDTLIHGVTGLAVAPRSAEQLASAIEAMAVDHVSTRRMGEAAKALAERICDVQRNAEHLLDLYRRVVADGR